MSDGDRLAESHDRLAAALEGLTALLRRERDKREPHTGREPTRMVRVSTMLRAFPGLAGAFKVVPESFLTPDERLRHVVVSCPCGQTPTLGISSLLQPCPGCNRSYVWDGSAVLACTREPDED